MAFSSTHVLFRINGVFGPSAAGGVEIWSCGMRINTGTTNNSEQAKTAFLETVSVPVNTFHLLPDVAAGVATWLTSVSAAYIGEDGKYVGGGAQTTTVRPYTTPPAGAGAQTSSWDVARAYTLRTAQARGRGHVGRFYYPCQGAVGTDGRWTVGQVTNAASGARAMIEQVNSAAKLVWTASFGVSVMSFVGGVSYQVNAVEVGRAPDTQRRRTNALVEAPVRSNVSGVLRTEEVVAGQVYLP
jgi:hypothetical protein